MTKYFQILFQIGVYPIICTLIFLAGSDSASAVGVSVKPNYLSVYQISGQSTSAQILVTNVSGLPAIYQVYPDDFTPRVAVEPQGVRLEPQASQIFTIRFGFWRPGLYQTNLSVVARSPAVNNLNTASGVKVPLTIKVSMWSVWFWIIGGGLTCLLVYTVVRLVLKLRKAIYETNR